MKSQVGTEVLMYAALFALMLSGIFALSHWLIHMKEQEILGERALAFRDEWERAVLMARWNGTETILPIPENCTIDDRVIACGENTVPHADLCTWSNLLVSNPTEVYVYPGASNKVECELR